MHTGRSFHRKPCRASISGAISPLLIEFLRLRNGSQRFLVVVPFGGPAVDVGALHLAPIAGALRVFDKRRGDVEIAQAADLSTIRQEPIELGRIAGRKVLQLLRNEPLEHPHELQDPLLVLRNTTSRIDSEAATAE